LLKKLAHRVNYIVYTLIDGLANGQAEIADQEKTDYE
jgi:hypothetical protein